MRTLGEYLSLAVMAASSTLLFVFASGWLLIPLIIGAVAFIYFDSRE